MKIAEKRRIVRKFMDGFSIRWLRDWATPRPYSLEPEEVEQVLRDYMNGKFSLKVKPRRKR